MFKALGDPTRLRIYEFLRACCCPVAIDDNGDVRQVDGVSVGAVCCHITGKERVSSTISEHLKELRQAGLVVVEKRGKNVLCAANPVAAAHLSAFFADTPVTAPAPDAAPCDCC